MLTSIRTTLALLFALLAVVTALQGAVTFQQLAKAEGDVDDVAERQLLNLGAIRDINSAFLRVRVLQLRLLLSEPVPQVIENNVVDLQHGLDDLQEARTRYERQISDAEEQAIHNRAKTTLTTYIRMSEPLVAEMTAGHVDDARAVLLKPWLRVLYRAGESQLREATTFVEARARAASLAGAQALTRAKVAALAAAVIAAVLAAFAIALSYWRILKPLGSVTRALNQLAAGDVAIDHVLSRRRDEIGAIGRAVEVFRSSLIRMRQAESDQREMQLLVQNISASTPDGIIAFDDAGLITFWNRAAEQLLGIDAEHVVGLGVETVLGSGPWTAALHQSEGVDRHGRLEIDLQHHDGTRIPVELSFSRWTQDGRVMSCAILRDIRDRKRDEAVLNRLAHTDALTGLPNRLVLTARMAEARDAGRAFAVLMVDLDHFKQVNDVFGHQLGDSLLHEAGRRLLACVTPADTVTRIGGDEFIVLLDNHPDPATASQVGDAMLQSLAAPFVVDGHTIHLGASIGMALAPSQARDPDELITCADLALYAAKAQGRHTCRVFTTEMRGAAMQDSLFRQELPRAVRNGEFTLYFQPQVRLADGALLGAEALIRWNHPQFGLVAPDRFIPVLESSPFAEEVGDWVLRTACRHAAEWRHACPMFRIGVNLSGAHFRSGRLAETVRSILAEFDLPATALEVEITEHVILRHDDQLIAPLRDLHDRGVSIAFDDYGTGYASLSFLKRFPLNRLKIDRSFVRTMGESAADAAIIRTILMLGRSLGLGVIAEGIETEAQAAQLRGKGCIEGQGYLFGRPMPAEDFEARFGLQPAAARRSA